MVEVMDGEDRVFFTEAVVRGERVCNPHLPIAQRIKAMHDARQEAGGGNPPLHRNLSYFATFLTRSENSVRRPLGSSPRPCSAS